MKNKEQKEFYLMVKGQKVVVSEEVYRTYKRSMRNDFKRLEREKRCIIEKVVNGKLKFSRCEGNCSLCEKNKHGNSMSNLSFDVMMDDGVDIPDISINIEEDLIKKETAVELHRAVSMLSLNQQEIIKAVYFNGESQKNVAQRLGVTTTAVNNALSRALTTLKKILEK